MTVIRLNILHSNKKQYRILDITIEQTVMNLKKLIFEETGTPVANMALALYDKKKKKVADLSNDGAIMSTYFPTTALGATDNWFVYVMDSTMGDDMSLVAKMHYEEDISEHRAQKTAEYAMAGKYVDQVP